MGELSFIINELERKKEHIQRAIDELKQAEAMETPEDKRQREEALRASRSRAAKKGWEKRKTMEPEEGGPSGQRAA